MEILTREVKFNIELKTAYIYNIQIINDVILISIDSNKFSAIDKFKMCSALKDCDICSMKYITLLVGIDEIGAIDVNKCRLVVGEYLTRGKVPFDKSIKCKLNALEKCSIISMFMPSNR